MRISLDESIQKPIVIRLLYTVQITKLETKTLITNWIQKIKETKNQC
jgi:hypothetical protein